MEYTDYIEDTGYNENTEQGCTEQPEYTEYADIRDYRLYRV